MELNLSSEEAAFRDEVRAFIAENYPADDGAGSRGKAGDSAQRRHRAGRLRRETNVQTTPLQANASLLQSCHTNSCPPIIRYGFPAPRHLFEVSDLNAVFPDGFPMASAHSATLIRRPICAHVPVRTVRALASVTATSAGPLLDEKPGSRFRDH
jgi:hypothetical protein